MPENNRKWIAPTALLCLCGLLNYLKPSDPFLTPYLMVSFGSMVSKICLRIMLNLHVRSTVGMGVRRNFSRGGATSTFPFIFFQVANDAMQMDLRERLYLFYTAKKIHHESTCSIRIFLKSYSGGVVFEFVKRLYSTFCHPLQLLLIWGIIQYHYYCEIQTTESEVDLNYPQLCLWCSH